MANNDLEFGRTLNNRVEIDRIGEPSPDPVIKILKDTDYDFLNEQNIESTIFSDGKFYCVQVSSWRTKQKALSESKKLNNSGYISFVLSAVPDHKSGTWYRVRIGYFNSIEETKEYLKLFE